MRTRRSTLVLGLALAAALAGAPPSAARAEFPDRPLRLISGFAAGGASDLIARMIAEAASPIIGQRIVVENRTGANGVIGAAETVRAGADGYTAFQCPMSTLAIAPQLQGATLPLDPGVELVPVANLALSSYGLVVRANGPYRNLADLLAAARARPGQITFASAGVGSAQHLSGELLKRLAGVDMVHVPYRGAAPAIVDILGGRTDFMITNLGDAARQIQAGELHLLAQGDPSRFPLFPDVPRIADTVPGFEVTGWFGICVPRGSPAEAIRRWAAAVRQAMADPALVRRLQDAGFTPHFEDTEAFTRRLEQDRRTWREVIQAGSIRAN
ncbi:MAG: tripartite tricarboxylate transporter substrate binding protein [Acetobacteraceae bacterium]|nr:tripartite tricarboxylate transporter substrate binding protein [Acetobacteraceae bacterium]